MSIIRKAILAFALMSGLAPAFAQAPAPVPALPDTERRTSYSITGTTCACAVNFALYGDSTDYANWLEVWVNGTRIPQAGNWTITSPTGSLSSIPRPVTDAVLTFTSVQTGTVQIVGARRPRRTSQFTENRGVAARDLNQALTDIVAQNRETWDKVNDVTGRAVLAPPGETLAILASAAARASQGACFDASGNLVSCVSVPGSTFTAGDGISLTGVGPTTITNNIQGSGPITITGTNPLIVGCATCNTSPAAASPAVFIATRANAITLDLHTFTVVRTGGYAAGGDGGEATFQNVGSAPFQDSFVSGGSLTAAGAGYTNGTYRDIQLTGGTGTGFTATVTVAGNVVTSISATRHRGNGYAVGDVLSAAAASLGGIGSGFTWTVSSVTTPTCSFTDSIGTHFQMVVESIINVKQCGAKVDYLRANGDAGSTDDTIAIQNALNFGARILPPTVDAYGLAGTKVVLSRGMALAGQLTIPFGVHFQGQGNYSSGLKMTNSLSDSVNWIQVCDTTTQMPCFGTQITDMLLITNGSPTAVGSASIIFSNNIQQNDFARRLVIFGGSRSCIRLTNGYGGAALVGISDVECGFSYATNPGFYIDLGSSGTIVNMSNIIVEGSGAIAQNGITIIGGWVNLTAFHTEGIVTGIYLNIPSSNSGLVQLHNLTGGAGCTNLVTRQGGSAANSNIIGIATGCTFALNNGGATTAGPIIADTVF